MVYFTRSATAKPGALQNAMKWAKKAAEHLNNKLGTKLNVYSQRYGDRPTGTIFWVGEYDSMSAIEEFGNKMAEDQEYLAMLPEFVELFVGGTTYDSILDKI